MVADPSGPVDDRALLERQLLRLTDDISVLIKAKHERARELQSMVETLRESQLAFARSYALIVEGNDPATRAHLDRTERWASAIADLIGLPDLAEHKLGFFLHDIGKWAVPKEIILKPGPLTAQEWKYMKIHPVAGAQMVSDVPILHTAIDVIRSHHEKWDGSGYPYGLSKEDIPRGARIFAVADVFDALTSDRPYRKAMPFEQAADIIKKDRASHFDPEAVDAFLEILAKMMAGQLTEEDLATPD